MTAQAYVVTIDETTSPVGIQVHPTPSDDLDDVLSVASADAATKDAALRSSLLGGVDSAWDTLQEIKAFVTADETTATALAVTVAGKAPTANPTFTGVAASPVWSASGIGGATSGARFVGGTTLGAPSTGTFLVRDWVVDGTGQIYVCTTAGTPGTWSVAGSGVELFYGESTTTESTSSTTASDLANPISFALPVVSRPVLIHAHSDLVYNNTASDGVWLGITDGTNVRSGFHVGTANSWEGLDTWWRIPANTTSATYRLQKKAVTGGTANYFGSAAGATYSVAFSMHIVTL